MSVVSTTCRRGGASSVPQDAPSVGPIIGRYQPFPVYDTVVEKVNVPPSNCTAKGVRVAANATCFRFWPGTGKRWPRVPMASTTPAITRSAYVMGNAYRTRRVPHVVPLHG